MTVYLNGKYLPRDAAMVSAFDRGFVFADGVYEVIRAYEGRFFGMEWHMKRLRRSLSELLIRNVDVEPLAEVSNRLLSENGLTTGDATVYIQVTRGTAPRAHIFPDSETRPTVFAAASPFEAPQHLWTDGAKAILVPEIRWARCDIKTVALVANVMASQKAKEAGAKEALFVRDGAITEGAHTNFCAVFDGVLQTAPLSNYILPGLTRKVVLEMCAEMDIPVREFPIFADQLKDADEAMILGTTTEVMPIVQIDEMMIRGGKPGPLTRKLQEAYVRRTRKALE